MNHNQYFLRQLLIFVIFPVATACLFIAISFFTIQRSQTAFFEQQLFDFIESNITPETVASDSFEAIGNRLLETTSIQHFSLYQAQPHRLDHYGLPIKLPEISLQSGRSTRWQMRSIAFKAFPIDANQWLIAGISTHELIINEYKNMFIVVILCIAVLSFVAFCTTKLHQSVLTPLQGLVGQTRKLLTQELDEPIHLKNPNIYDELVDVINEIVRFQKGLVEEIQSLGEQSTNELRETLETLEIQHIELDMARKNALQASKAKSEFLANTSHELRTPLNGILGFTSLLLKTELSNQQRDYLATIEQSSQGLLTVINDILDFSKLETGQLTLEYKPISLHEIVEEIFTIYAPSAHEKNLRLLSMIHRSVQQNLLGDPHRIKQVITNLVTNAIKFSSRGSIILKATSLSETDNRTELKISITDNGIGLTDEQQEQLFTAFSKVDSSDSRLQGGAGLGLAIAKGLIHRMQGEIGVESSPNQGSTFWFTLRLGIDKTHSAQSPLQNSLYGINALIYDANDDCRAEIAHYLNDWGVFYREENSLINIENPLAETKNQSGFDIVILDAYTDQNSFDRDKLLRIIHNINARYQLPVIILAPSSIQRLLQDDILGLNTVIVQRPVQHAVLHQAICNHLDIIQPMPHPDVHAGTPSNITSQHNIQVLVVEDNPANLKLVEELLKGLGVQVTAAENGYSALQLCESTPFDLIFMDVQMPGIDGLETTRQLREKEVADRTPIIALTAHAVDEQKKRLLLAGMDDYLSKPVSESDLRMMIKRWTHGVDFTPEPTSSVQPSTPVLPKETPIKPSKPSKPKVFDWAQSMELAKQKPDLAKDMLKMLVDSIDPTRDAITSALNTSDWEFLMEVVHKFHGGCCYCGVPALRLAAKEVEDALYANHESIYKEKVHALYTEMDALVAWLGNYDVATLFSDE